MNEKHAVSLAWNLRLHMVSGLNDMRKVPSWLRDLATALERGLYQQEQREAVSNLRELLRFYRGRQHELADELGITNGYISHIKTGYKRKPGPDLIRKINQLYEQEQHDD